MSELPEQIKNLYKHWNRHTNRQFVKNFLPLNSVLITEICDFINERLSIFQKKEQGISKPYTSDPILSTYRFCNIYRELDRQTIFYHQLLKPLETDFPLWLLNMLFCRSICNTDTVSKISLLSFEAAENEKVFRNLSQLPSPKYGNAYIFPISVIQKSDWNTRESFFCKYYPQIIRDVAAVIEAFYAESVVAAQKAILAVFGFNLKFLWTEVLIDIAYQYPNKIDLFKQFPIGPGSIPTMKKLCPTEDPEITNTNLIGMFDSQLDLPTYNGKTVFLSAENWEGIGCEFRKYTNLKTGSGRKRLYK